MADSNLQVNINGRDNLSPVVQNIESKLIRFVGAVSSAVAAVRVATFPIAAAGNFEREMANVKKTTEFSTQQIKMLGDELEKLSLRMNVSAVDLAKIAAAAGQQGLGTLGPEGIALFTESVSRMSSVLDITADEAATSVGKIMNIFKVSVNDIEKVVAGFNESSNNSTASGTELLDVVRRIGDAAGTINLQESLGLAATGIDFGVSPEVVGTTYGKVFADMRAKAEEFAVLMKMSTNEWITYIDTEGGIAAYKAYLARLRQLGSAEQAKAISELSGRGRIFQLVNKNVQDTQNAVLDRNLAVAADGYTKGTSAIREQQTVLETLNEQFAILKNSVFALSTEAGDQMLAPLTAYVAQLSAALQQPAVRSFIEAIGKSMVDLIDLFVGLMKEVASWNVNWENLIAVAKVFVGVKLAETLIAITGRVSGLTAAYTRLTASTRGATAAQQAANAAAAGGAAAQTGTLRNILNLWNERRQAVAAATAAEQAHARAVANNRALEEQLGEAASTDRTQRNAGRNANLARTAAAAATREAQNAAAQAAADLEARRNAKLEASQRTYQANVAAIEAEFRGKRTVADQANKQALLQAEERHLNRVTASTNSYYTRRLAAAEASGLQLIAQAQAEQARLNQVYAQAEAARLAAMGQTSRARALLERSDEEVRRSTENLRRAEDAANRAGSAFRNLGVFVAGVAAIFRFSLTAISGVFFWVTLLYTALDAFGLLDNLGQWFQNLTDKIGLTSEARRKEAERSKQLQEELKKEEERVKALAEEYQKLKDKSTGRVDDTMLKGAQGQIRTGGVNAQRDGLTTLGQGLQAADQELNRANTGLNTYGERAKKAAAEVDKFKKALEDAKRVESQSWAASNWRELQANVKTAEKELAAAEARLKSLGKTNDEGARALAATAAENQKRLADTVNSVFTDKSAALFQEHIVRISQAQKEVQELTKRRQEAAQKQNEVNKNDTAKMDEAKKATDALDQELVALNEKIAKMQKAFKDARDAIVNDKTITDKIKDSVVFLGQFLEIRDDVVQTFSKQLTQNQTSGAKLTGENVPTRPAPDTGTDTTTDLAKEESEGKKRARARLQLERARAEAEAALKRESNDQLMREDERAYNQGLTAIDSYYEERQKRLLQNNQNEIAANRRQIAIAQRERADRKAMGAPESELMRFDADIAKLNGEIAVLQARRRGIVTETANEVTDAYEALTAKINATSLSLAEQLGVQDLNTFFADNLTAYNEQYKEFFGRLLLDGGEAGAKLAQQLKQAGRLDSLSKVMSTMGQESERAYKELDNYTARLELLRGSGVITTNEMELMAERQRAATAAQLQTQIEAQEVTLDRMAQAGDRGTKAFKDMQQTLDDNRLKLEQLKSIANQVAVEINRSIASGIQQSLNTLLSGPMQRELSESQRAAMDDNKAAINRLRDNVAFLERARTGVLSGYEGQNGNIDAQLEKTKGEIAALEAKNKDLRDQAGSSFLDTMKEAARGFGLSIADALQNAATKSLAEKAMSGIGSFFGGSDAGGGGGIGGFISTLFGGGGEPGSSPSNPMYTKDADEAGLVGAFEALDTMTGEDGALSKVFDAFDEGAADSLAELADGFDGTLGGLAKGLSGVFNSLFGDGGANFGSILKAGAQIIGMFHTGGVVGSTFNPRFAHPTVFANAVRYHTGGIAGLAPNEVPAILQRGEEVLTASDPRHRNNAGGDGGSTSVVVNVNMESGATEVSGTAGDARELGRKISAVVIQEIANQKRPGGLLSK